MNDTSRNAFTKQLNLSVVVSAALFPLEGFNFSPKNYFKTDFI